MKSVNIHEAKTKLSAMLAEIEKGESYIVCRNGTPVAQIIPHKKKKRTIPHPSLSKISINYDPTEELTAYEWGG